MFERLVENARRLYRWYSMRRNHPAFRLLHGACTVGILAASAWFIWSKASSGYATILATDVLLDPRRLIVSSLCTAASTALGAWEWTLLINALGARLDVARGMRIHLTANLVKYVPGFVWPYVGKTYLASRQGVPAKTAALSVVGELLVLFLDGFLVLLLSLPNSGIVSWSAPQRLALQMSAMALAGIIVVGIPFAGRRLMHLLGEGHLAQGLPKRIDWGQIVFVVVAVLLTWYLLGFGFSALSVPMAPSAWRDVLRQTTALALALLVGQVAFFAPLGIGVREAILIALLGSDGSAAVIVVAALVFRIEMMIGEVTCALIAILVGKLRAIRQNNPNG